MPQDNKNLYTSMSAIVQALSGLYTHQVKLTSGLSGLSLSSVTPTGNTLASQYCLVDNDGNQLGTTTIDIPKDQFLSGAVYNQSTQKLTLVFNTLSGSTTSSTIDFSKLVDVYNGASGITKVDVNGTPTFIGVVDTNDADSFLTVGSAGFRLAGVNTAINTAATAASAHVVSSVIGDYSTAVASGTTVFDRIKGLRTDIGVSGQTGTKSLFSRIAALQTSVFGSDPQAGDSTLAQKVAAINTTIGTSGQTANASGSLFARIKQNSADIESVTTRVDSLESSITGKMNFVDAASSGQILIADEDGDSKASGYKIVSAFGTDDDNSIATNTAVDSRIDTKITIYDDLISGFATQLQEVKSKIDSLD